jgi:hypothetical protein
MKKPRIGKKKRIKIQRNLATGPAELCAVLMMAQIKTINHSKPSGPRMRISMFVHLSALCLQLPDFTQVPAFAFARGSSVASIAGVVAVPFFAHCTPHHRREHAAPDPGALSHRTVETSRAEEFG